MAAPLSPNSAPNADENKMLSPTETPTIAVERQVEHKTTPPVIPPPSPTPTPPSSKTPSGETSAVRPSGAPTKAKTIGHLLAGSLPTTTLQTARAPSNSTTNSAAVPARPKTTLTAAPSQHMTAKPSAKPSAPAPQKTAAPPLPSPPLDPAPPIQNKEQPALDTVKPTENTKPIESTEKNAQEAQDAQVSPIIELPPLTPPPFLPPTTPDTPATNDASKKAQPPTLDSKPVASSPPAAPTPSSSMPIVRRQRFLAAETSVGDKGMRSLVHGTIILTALSLTSFVVWAVMTFVNEITTSQGEIVPSGAIQTVQHLEGGIVTNIFVVDGQFVEVGTPLVQFDAASAIAEKSRLQIQKYALQLQIERLKAHLENRRPSWPAAPFDQASILQEQSLQEQSGASSILQEQINLFKAEEEARRTQTGVLQRQIESKQSELQAAIANQIPLRQQITLLQEELDVREKLYRKQLNPRMTLLSSRLQLSTTQADLKKLIGSEEIIRRDIAALVERQADLIAQIRREYSDRLGQAVNDMSQASETLKGMDDRMKRLSVSSPVRGVVQNIPIKTRGAVVQPGGMIAEVVPVEEDLIAETRITTRDIGFIASNQAANIKVSTFDFTRFGTISAKVISISPTTFLDEQRQPYYKVRMRLSRNYVQRKDIRYLLLPGMTVQADIVTGRKTVFEYLLKPIYATTSSAFHER
ncbi:membrane fusion protein, adhesin transport system [Azospirillaceae bacterium]